MSQAFAIAKAQGARSLSSTELSRLINAGKRRQLRKKSPFIIRSRRRRIINLGCLRFVNLVDYFERPGLSADVFSRWGRALPTDCAFALLPCSCADGEVW